MKTTVRSQQSRPKKPKSDLGLTLIELLVVRMKTRPQEWNRKTELNRQDRIILHVRCFRRDHKYLWHVAGVWREVTLH